MSIGAGRKSVQWFEMKGRWRVSGSRLWPEGSWHDPTTKESLHPDLGHGLQHGPHWDYRDPSGHDWRIKPDGSVTPK